MLKWLWISTVVFVSDQITKYIANSNLTLYQSKQVLPFFDFTLAYNRGAAFSFLSDASGWQRWFFTVIAIAVSVAIVIWLKRLKSNEVWSAVALALILGGAIGNVFDRIIFGYVIDFLDVYYQQWHWPAFNIADSCISVGAVMLIVDGLFFKKQDQEASPPVSTDVKQSAPTSDKSAK